jgi:acylphosphatase
VEARHILVSGIVQGVGFRQFTARMADDIGVSGWVRNLEDGRVEIYVEGTEAQVSALIARCRRGPRSAEVTDIAVRPVPARGADGFAIERTAMDPEA